MLLGFSMSNFIPNHATRIGRHGAILGGLKPRGALGLRGCHGAPVNSPLVCSHPPLCFPSDGLAAFRAFLRTEFSEENLEFWLACEEYKKVKSQSKMASKAKKIFAEYIAIQSCKEVSGSARRTWILEKKWDGNLLLLIFPHTMSHFAHLFCFFPHQVNLDSYTRDHTKDNLQNVTRSCFELAQRRIYGLMEKDSYPRFLRSELYVDLINQKKASSTSTSSSS